MSLLTITQDVSLRVGLASPASAISSPDTTVQQVVAYAQDAGDDLSERWSWRIMKKAATFTGDGTTTLFNLPTDFGTLSPSDTFTSSIYPTLMLRGPINEDDLLRLKAFPILVSPSVWRLIGAKIEFFPAPANGEIISYVYKSKFWITDSGGTARTTGRWAADTDLSVISERLVMLGAIWMWKRGKGLDYAEEFNSFERAFDRLAGQENTEREISTTSAIDMPENFWPGAITYTSP